MEWTVVTVIVALVGLFFTIGKPIINLNTNIVKLNVSLDALRDRTDKQETELKTLKEHEHDSHQRLWDHNKEQDVQLADHEKRISSLENS